MDSANTPPTTATVQPATLPSSTTVTAALIIQELAAASGLTPQSFLAQTIGEVLAPFEKELADRLCNLIERQLTQTGEVSKPNEQINQNMPDSGDITLPHGM